MVTAELAGRLHPGVYMGITHNVSTRVLAVSTADSLEFPWEHWTEVVFQWPGQEGL